MSEMGTTTWARVALPTALDLAFRILKFDTKAGMMECGCSRWLALYLLSQPKTIASGIDLSLWPIQHPLYALMLLPSLLKISSVNTQSCLSNPCSLSRKKIRCFLALMVAPSELLSSNYLAPFLADSQPHGKFRYLGSCGASMILLQDLIPSTFLRLVLLTMGAHVSFTALFTLRVQFFRQSSILQYMEHA